MEVESDSGLEREQLRSQICNFLLERFPQSTERFKEYMRAEVQDAGSPRPRAVHHSPIAFVSVPRRGVPPKPPATCGA